MTAATVVHHPDCDGWRCHAPRVVIDWKTDRNAGGHAECVADGCDWRSPAVGSVDLGLRTSMLERERRFRGHDHAAECVGECAAWS